MLVWFYAGAMRISSLGTNRHRKPWAFGHDAQPVRTLDCAGVMQEAKKEQLQFWTVARLQHYLLIHLFIGFHWVVWFLIGFTMVFLFSQYFNPLRTWICRKISGRTSSAWTHWSFPRLYSKDYWHSQRYSML